MRKSDFLKSAIALVFLVAALYIFYSVGIYSATTRLELNIKAVNADLESSRKNYSDLEKKLLDKEKELSKASDELDKSKAVCEAYRNIIEAFKKQK